MVQRTQHHVQNDHELTSFPEFKKGRCPEFFIFFNGPTIKRVHPPQPQERKKGKRITNQKVECITNLWKSQP